MPHAIFTTHFANEFQGITFVIDRDGPRSVTNDAEHVVEHVLARWPKHRIFYRDSEKQWSELAHDNHRWKFFKPFTPAERGLCEAACRKHEWDDKV